MTADAAVSWPKLTSTQRRVLGVLVEKAKTTPDIYPLSVNAVVSGSNQKSNRDPILSLVDDDVERTLEELQPMGLVTRIQGGRVERWRHNLYEVWQVDKVELAILAELLLRGAQTEGELRGRASRMEPIDDLETLRARLKPMAERRLVIFLGPEGRRGSLITHGFHSPQELESASATRPREEAVNPAMHGAGSTSNLEARFAALEAEVAALKSRLGSLEEKLGVV
ncbi:MAG: DUF480 domain-containing protein [Planctomycetes bacterium]|nr:DUF480 domain-containing protein [Planctomycetota bacterium]